MDRNTEQLAIAIVEALRPLVRSCNWEEPHSREAVTVRVVGKVLVAAALREGPVGEPSKDIMVAVKKLALEFFRDGDGPRFEAALRDALSKEMARLAPLPQEGGDGPTRINDLTLAVCRAAWPVFHPGAKYDGWAHWPSAVALRQAVTDALREALPQEQIEVALSALNIAALRAQPAGEERTQEQQRMREALKEIAASAALAANPSVWRFADIARAALSGEPPLPGGEERSEPSQEAIEAAREASAHTVELGMADHYVPRHTVIAMLRAYLAVDRLGRPTDASSQARASGGSSVAASPERPGVSD